MSMASVSVVSYSMTAAHRQETRPPAKIIPLKEFFPFTPAPSTQSPAASEVDASAHPGCCGGGIPPAAEPPKPSVTAADSCCGGSPKATVTIGTEANVGASKPVEKSAGALAENHRYKVTGRDYRFSPPNAKGISQVLVQGPASGTLVLNASNPMRQVKGTFVWENGTLSITLENGLRTAISTVGSRDSLSDPGFMTSLAEIHLILSSFERGSERLATGSTLRIREKTTFAVISASSERVFFDKGNLLPGDLDKTWDDIDIRTGTDGRIKQMQRVFSSPSDAIQSRRAILWFK